MKQNLLRVMLAAHLVALTWTATALAGAERALCLVCKVKEGATDAEEVRAVREHEGARYGFCSSRCAQEFEGDPLAFIPPTFPRAAPELRLAALDGDSISWERLKGKVVLVDFWATWCPPCRKSMPELQALYDRYADRGFTVLGVSIDEGGPARVRKFVAGRRIRYPIALDHPERPAWERFRVKAVPAAFLVDQEGRIVAQWTGAPADVRELEGMLGPLLEKRSP
jgi:peroxiredoxin